MTKTWQTSVPILSKNVPQITFLTLFPTLIWRGALWETYFLVNCVVTSALLLIVLIITQRGPFCNIWLLFFSWLKNELCGKPTFPYLSCHLSPAANELSSTVPQFVENSLHFPRHPKSSVCHHCPKLLWNGSFQNFSKCEHVLGYGVATALKQQRKKKKSWSALWDFDTFLIGNTHMMIISSSWKRNGEN